MGEGKLVNAADSSYLIEELVDQYELLSNVILIEIAEVGLAEIHELEEELNNHRCIHVAFGCREDDDIFVADVDEGCTVDVNDRGVLAFLSSHDVRAELHRFSSTYIVLVHAVDQDLSLHVYEHNRAYHLLQQVSSLAVLVLSLQVYCSFYNSPNLLPAACLPYRMNAVSRLYII